MAAQLEIKVMEQFREPPTSRGYLFRKGQIVYREVCGPIGESLVSFKFHTDTHRLAVHLQREDAQQLLEGLQAVLRNPTAENS